jgi:gliding motility-associated-like protein
MKKSDRLLKKLNRLSKFARLAVSVCSLTFFVNIGEAYSNDDYATTISTMPVKIDILANDLTGNNCNEPAIEIIKEPANGEGRLNTDDKTLIYIPDANFTGLDTLTCRVICNGEVTTANVYVIVLKPLSLKYIACPDAVTIGFNNTVAGVQYYWFAAENGGSPISDGNPSNTLTVTKDNTPVQTWWVEAVYNGTIFPRYRIELELSDNCGTTYPSGCAATGTILYKEDFGGNSPTDPEVKPNGIEDRIHYTYNMNLSGWGVYTIAKSTNSFSGVGSIWYENIKDHTYPNDMNRGYMAGFDATEGSGQFYAAQIDNLCPGMHLYFSLWLMSLYKTVATNATNQVFLLEDLNGNVLAQYYTGDIPDKDPVWKQYGFNFTIPDDQSSIILRIINNGKGSYGNDFVMDDIEIRLCVPPVTLTQPNTVDTVLCKGASLTLAGAYTDDGTFTGRGSELVYRWERNITGNLNNPNDWTFIAGTQNTSTTGSVTGRYTIDKITAADSGYYRLVVSNEEHINNFNCRAMLEIVHLRVIPDVVSGIISADRTVCYGSSLKLTSTAATGGSAPLTYQWQESTDGGLTWADVPDDTGHASDYTSQAITQTTHYSLITTGGTGFCETDTSNTVMITVLSPIDTVVIDTAICRGATYNFNNSIISATGAYITHFTAVNGCDSVVALNLTVKPDVAVDFKVLADTVCSGNSPSILLENMHENYTYSVYANNTFTDKLASLTGVNSGTVDLDIPLKNDTVYYIKVTDNAGCISNDWKEALVEVIKLYIEPAELPRYHENAEYTQILNTNAQPPAFTVVEGNLPGGLFLNASGVLYGKALSSEHSTSNIFTVQVQDANGCIAIREYTLDGDIFVPEIFTPNGDGINDIFMQGYRVVIVNRLGIEIFRGNDGWNGTYKGKVVASDIYFYKMEYADENGKTRILTGYVGVHY